MEVMVTSGAVRRAEIQSIVTTNKPTPNFLQARCLADSVEVLKGNIT